MNTIREAFSFNLRVLRGSRTQAEMSEALEMPLRTYQKLEAGQMPQQATLDVISQKMGISELSLVQVPGEIAPKPLAPPDLASEINALRIEMHQLRTQAGELFPFWDIISKLPSLKEDELRMIRNIVGFSGDRGDGGSGAPVPVHGPSKGLTNQKRGPK